MQTIEYQGKTLTLKEWSDETGLTPDAIRTRLNRGWPPERILATPTKTSAAPLVKISKNDAEVYLNGLEISEVPASLVDLVKGVRTKRYGTRLRTYNTQEFDEWFEKEYSPKYTS